MSGRLALPSADHDAPVHRAALVIAPRNQRNKQCSQTDTGTEALLRAGDQALHIDGDLVAGRRCYDAAFRSAEKLADWPSMASAAIGFSGLWVSEQRNTIDSTLIEDRLRQALATTDPRSSLGLRLRARLAAESDYRRGLHAAVLAVRDEARRAGDAVASAEATSLAHHCLLGPEHGSVRRQLAQELLADSSRTMRSGYRRMGLLWTVVDLFLDGDRHAERRLMELREMQAQQNHTAAGFVVRGIDVMLCIRSGLLDEAESMAAECAEAGRASGDVDAVGWYGAQLVTIRWYQGRLAELLPQLVELVDSPTLSAVDNSFLAVLALAAAKAGDPQQALSALGKVRAGSLSLLPRSSTWLVTMYAVVEAACLLGEVDILAEAYKLLAPFADLPMMASLAISCFGSVQQALGIASLGTGAPDRAIEHFRSAVRDNLALGHWPAATISRARLAQALAVQAGEDRRAEIDGELDVAGRDAAMLGITLPAEVDTARTGNVVWPDARHRITFRRQGSKLWEVRMDRATAKVEHNLGMEYLATLVSNQGYEVPAIELLAGRQLPVAPVTESVSGSIQPVLDSAAKRAYKDKLAVLEAEIDEHELNHDLGRAEQVRAERDWLLAELAAATGLGGRARTFSGADERARISVGKAIRRALDRIETAEPAIGLALRASILTGRRCCYRPY